MPVIKKLILLGCALSVVVLLAVFFEPKPDQTSKRPEQSGRELIDYTSHVLRGNVSGRLPFELPEKALPVAGITSHHLPTAEGFIDQFYRQLLATRPEVKRFLIVGPDHFERCQNLASFTGKDFLTPYGVLENQPDIGQALLGNKAGEDSACFANEHSIGVQASFIKKYFPKAKASALIFSSAASVNLPEQLAGEVFKNYPDTMVVGSIDFSHYQTAVLANQIDAGTQKQIENMDVGVLKLEQLDSPASLRFVIAYATMQKSGKPYLAHTNSFDFTGVPDNTTGYFNVIFTQN